MAESTRTSPAPDRQQPRRQADEPATREEREEAHRQSVEALSSPETPTPTQEEADAIKEGAVTGNPPPEGTPVAGETEAQRRTRAEREAKEQRDREQRDVKPGETRSGYQTR
jgi:hypothetical protein